MKFDHLGLPRQTKGKFGYLVPLMPEALVPSQAQSVHQAKVPIIHFRQRETFPRFASATLVDGPGCHLVGTVGILYHETTEPRTACLF